jgi:hypothetical protein
MRLREEQAEAAGLWVSGAPALPADNQLEPCCAQQEEGWYGGPAQAVEQVCIPQVTVALGSASRSCPSSLSLGASSQGPVCAPRSPWGCAASKVCPSPWGRVNPQGLDLGKGMDYLAKCLSLRTAFCTLSLGLTVGDSLHLGT